MYVNKGIMTKQRNKNSIYKIREDRTANNNVNNAKMYILLYNSLLKLQLLLKLKI